MHGTPTFAAVIAHADDSELLRRCITHHLEIGVDHIFVSLNLDDPESQCVIDAFDSRAVRAERVERIAPDQFDYFTPAMRFAMEWAAPDWILFADSDEFWIPADGLIRNTKSLASTDFFSVQRFNIPPVRRSDGTIGEIAIADPEAVLVIAQRHVMDADFLLQHPELPWLNARIGPKLMVRPEFVETIAQGAHAFVPRMNGAREATPPDLLVLHLPFTTEARFRRKIEAIRKRMQTVGHRYQAGEAWHWRRWLAVDDAGSIADEYLAQIVEESAIPELVSLGALTTPARLFAEHRLTCE